MKTLILLTGFLHVVFGSGTARFGFEEISAFYNKNKVAHWVLNKTTVDRIILENFNVTDTLFLSGFCDSGCLDGTIIRISDSTGTAATITRRSAILHDDTIMSDSRSAGKKMVLLDATVSFFVTKEHLKHLTKNKLYQISVLRIIDPKAKTIHIFDLEIK